jgi:hypothetical protein
MTRKTTPRVASCLAALLMGTAGAGCSSGNHGSANGAHNNGGSPGGGSDAGGNPGSGGQDSGPPQGGGTLPDSGGSSDAPAGSTEGGGGSDAGNQAPVPPSQVPSGWTLALDDEFNGSALSSNWGIGTNLGTFVDDGTTYWKPYQPDEAEYLTASMVAVENGNLILSTEAAPSPLSGPDGTKSYIAGYVTSYNKFAFQYGYIEFRMEMPDVAAGSQTGLWPALWMLNSTYSNADEIDVLESYGADQTAIQMTAQPSNSVDDTIAIGAYHILGVLHQESTIAFYVDNQLLKSFNQSMSSEMAILMGMQLGSAAFGWLPGPMPSNWPGGIHGPMTADFKVDWVHVWTPP